MEINNKEFQDLKNELEEIKKMLLPVISEAKRDKQKWLSVSDIMDLTGFKKAWVYARKERIGFSDIDGAIVFTRANVEAFMNSNYFKAKR